MRTLSRLMISAVALTAMCGCGQKHDGAGQQKTPAQALIERLQTLESNGRIAFGHQDDPVYGHAWVGDEGRSDVLEVAGEYPAVMGWDLGGLEIESDVNLDSVPFDRMRSEVLSQAARGGINVFSWHPRNPVDSADSWSVADTTIVWQMAHNPEVAERYRNQVRQLARFFNSLTLPGDSAKVGIVFRPWHEHTGNWFWWGTPNCSADDYHYLWSEMRSVMDEEGVDNVVWAYSPDRVRDAEQYMERYPGDEYVDILGVDVYHFGGEAGLERYREDASRSLDIVRSLAAEHGKLAAFTETGSESLPMEGWWSEVLLPMLKEHPVSYVLVWRNAHDKPNHFYGPWPGHPSVQSFMEFYNDSTTVFVNQMP